MADSKVIAALDPATLQLDSATVQGDHHTAERWNAWQQRGRVRDARISRRMNVMATLVAVAFAAMLGWAAFSIA